MDDFLRLSASTARFTHGAPRAFSFGDDGRLLWFLRSTGPTDPVDSLWVLDTATGTETLLADPRALWTGPGDLPGPRYVFRGPARGPLASGPGMTFAPCRSDDNAV
ncbi:hypothetical protein ACF1BP_37530, partial [Streptomyces sp. NPDC014735]